MSIIQIASRARHHLENHHLLEHSKEKAQQQSWILSSRKCIPDSMFERLSMNKRSFLKATMVALGAIVLVLLLAMGFRTKRTHSYHEKENLTSSDSHTALSGHGEKIYPGQPEDDTRARYLTDAPSQAPSQSQSHTGSFFPGFLVVLENGLSLSQGLTSRIIAESGEKVKYANGGQSDIDFHPLPDFGATFWDPRNGSNPGGWIYVSNSEDRDDKEGGVGAITFNSQGQVIEYRMLLENSTANCGGGPTPWGSFISCEETSGGNAYQVDPTGERESRIITLGSDGGRFESFAYDIYSTGAPQFFLTEDRDAGKMQRFRPSNPDWNNPWDILYGEGLIDYLMLVPDSGTFWWTSDSQEAENNAEEYYPNSEGIDIVGHTLYFVSKQKKQLYILDLNSNTYVSDSTENGAFDGQPDTIVTILRDQDDLLFFTEDSSSGYPGIHARSRSGQYYTLLESAYDDEDETTGLYFSPDGMHLYFALQDAGLVYDVIRTDGQSFNAMALNIKYHTNGRDRRRR